MIALGALGIWLALAGPAPSLAACDVTREKDPAHWRGYTCIYVYARKSGDYEGAIRRTRALVEAEPERTWARYILADLLLDSGMEGAPKLYDEVSREFEAQGDFESAALSRVAYAFSFEAEGPEEIGAQLKNAIGLAERADDPQLLGQVRLQQVRLMLRSGGPLGQAAQVLARAREATFPDGPYEQKKFVLLLEAELEEERDRPDRALERLQALQALAASQGDRYLETSIELRQLDMMAEYPQLRGTHLEEISRRLGAVDAEALEDNPHAKAKYICLRGDFAPSERAAREFYERCRAAASVAGATGTLRSALQGLALLDGDEALLAEAGRLERSEGGLGVFAQQLTARIRFRKGDWRGALEAASVVFDAIQRIGARQGDALVRAQLLSSRTPYYDEIASWTLGPGPNYERPRIDAALQVVERLRARTISDALSRADVDLPTLNTLDYAALSQKISRVNTELSDPDLETSARATLLDELTTLEREEAALFDAWAARHPRDTGREPPTVSEIQDALAPGQAVLSFQMVREPFAAPWEQIPQHSWVAVITHDDVRVVALPPAERVEPIIELFAGAVHDAEPSRGLGAGLYEMLLEEVVERLPSRTRHLLIVPDGKLHRVPFSALGPANGESVGQRFSIARAPSIAVWLRLRHAPRASRNLALALVGPEVDDPRLEPLPSAPAEGQALSSVADTVVREGVDASEAFFLRSPLSDFAVVHFGAHAVLDDEHPERAAVVLAAGGSEHDGLLQPRELARLEFDGSVVVLAACRGAAGPILGEEGPMSLAHALFRGGARTVVASLWPMDDAAAAAFFTRLYQALGRGMSVADAAAQVRRELRAEGYPATAWAGVVVLGDGDHVPLQAKAPVWPDLLGGFVVFGFLIALLRTRASP